MNNQILKKQNVVSEEIPCSCGCSLTRPQYDNRGRERKFIDRHKGQKSRFKKGKPHVWQDRKYVDGYGYTRIYKPEHLNSDTRGYVREHRIVFEEYHKCCLLHWVIVHHKNENKLDNRIENLEVMNRSNHTKYHNPIGFKVET